VLIQQNTNILQTDGHNWYNNIMLCMLGISPLCNHLSTIKPLLNCKVLFTAPDRAPVQLSWIGS